MELVLKNYRSFSQKNPLKLTIEDGVTALVGPNNAGKSFVLRSFYELRPIYAYLRNHDALLGILKGKTQRISFPGVHALEVFHKFNTGNIKFVFQEGPIKMVFAITRGESPSIINGNLYVEEEEVGPHLTGFNDESTDKFIVETIAGRKFDLIKFVRFFESATNSLYVPAFRNAINIGAAEDYFDIDIGEAFIRRLHDFSTNSDHRIRDRFRSVQADLKDLFGYSVFEIKESIERKQIFVAINEQSHLLADLGGGITQFILVFINAAVKNPDLILIDEPELNLHPKLQMDFVNRLLKYTKRGMIYATHDLGLAHSTAERIYAIHKTDDDKESIISPFEETPKFTEFLGELNFSNFANLRFNKVLLVEGTTDVKVFITLLRKFDNKYKDTLVLPLGGTSLINKKTAQEMSELKRFGSKVKIVGWIDSEKESETDSVEPRIVEFKKGCKNLGIEITISDRRSIENYFPEAAVKKVNPGASSLEPHDPIPTGWSKQANWKIAQETNPTDLEGTDLHSFLKSI